MILKKLPLVLLIFLVFCEKKTVQEISELDDYFEKEKVVHLEPDEYLSVRFVDVNDRGHLLVTGRQDKVLLFDSMGTLIRDLGENAKVEHPGLNWSPNRAVFTPEGSIFVQNNAPWGLYFDEDGNYENTAPSDFFVSNRFAVGDGGLFYSMDITPDGAYIRQIQQDGEEFNRFDEIQDTYINLMQRYRVGNQLIAADGFLFFMMVAEPGLYRLDMDHGISHFNEPPGYHKQATGDISARQRVEPAIIAEEISNFTENYTISYSLHQLTDRLLIMQFQNRPDVLDGAAGFGIQMVTTDGRFLMDSDLLTDEWIVAAGNGKIYTMVQQDEAYESPRLNVYRIRDSFMQKI